MGGVTAAAAVAAAAVTAAATTATFVAAAILSVKHFIDFFRSFACNSSLNFNQKCSRSIFARCNVSGRRRIGAAAAFVAVGAAAAAIWIIHFLSIYLFMLCGSFYALEDVQCGRNRRNLCKISRERIVYFSKGRGEFGLYDVTFQFAITDTDLPFCFWV